MFMPALLPHVHPSCATPGRGSWQGGPPDKTVVGKPGSTVTHNHCAFVIVTNSALVLGEKCRAVPPAVPLPLVMQHCFTRVTGTANCSHHSSKAGLSQCAYPSQSEVQGISCLQTAVAPLCGTCRCTCCECFDVCCVGQHMPLHAYRMAAP